MSAQPAYLSSIFVSFSTFLAERQISGATAHDAQLALGTILEHKTDWSNWDTQRLAGFWQTPAGLQHTSNAQALATAFIRRHPPTQINVFLHEFALALNDSGCSHSTIKNYRSDISQFAQFAKESDLPQLITKPKVVAFLRQQRSAGLKHSSIRRKLVSLQQFAQWAAGLGIIPGQTWFPELFAALENAQPLEVLDASASRPKPADSTQTRVVAPVPVTKTESIIADKTLSAAESPRTHQERTAQLQSVFSRVARKHLRRPQFGNNPGQWALTILVLLISLVGIGFFGYQQFILRVSTPFAYPSSPVRPNRQLSFQGRLTDTAQNPVTAATDMRFYLFDTGPATGSGTELWDSGICSVTPDQDGIFSVGLGDDCGAEITEDVFSENSNVWLEVEIETETLNPRQAIQTVPYALNSETLQGYPITASGAATVNTVVTMNSGGEVVLGEVSPTIRSVSGTFSLEAQTLSLETSSGSNGDIILSPDGTGQVEINADTVIDGYLYAPGATLSATYAGGTALVTKGGPSGTANIQEWQNSAGSALTVVDESGNIGIGSTNPAAPLDVNGVVRVGSYITFNGDSGSRLRSDSTGLFSVLTGSGGAYGSMQFGNGSAASPSIRFGNDADTGFFSADTNTELGITVGGTERLRVDNSGNLGVGSTAPGAALDVVGNFRLTGTTTLNSLTYTWPASQASGYVLSTNGSGTLSWSDPAVLAGGTNLWDTASGALYPKNSTLDLLIGATATTSAKFAFINVNSGTPTASVSAGAAGATYLTADGKLAATAMQNITIGDTATTGDVIINPSRNVGIGTTTATSKLTVNGSVLLNLTSSVIDFNSSSYRFGRNGNDFFWNVAGAEQLRLRFDGNLGVGTSSPTQVLDVDGDLRVRGNDITDSGDTTRISLGATTTLTNTNTTLSGTTTLAAATLDTFTTGTSLSMGSTTALTLGSNATINGGSAANDDLTLQGTSDATRATSYLLLQPTAGNVGIGTTAPSSQLHVYSTAPNLRLESGSANNISIALVNSTYNSAILQRSTGQLDISNQSNQPIRFAGSGTSWMDMTSDGLTLNAQRDLRLADSDSSNYLAFQAPTTVGSNITYTFPDTLTNGYILQTDGSGTLTWADPAVLTGGTNLWDTASGALYPKNSTLDLLIGATATTSAKFAFINVNSGNPTATISGNLALAVPTGADPATTLDVFNGGSLNLRTSVGGNAGSTSRLFVANNGNIGVGTSSPSVQFEIRRGASTTAPKLYLAADAGNENDYVTELSFVKDTTEISSLYRQANSYGLTLTNRGSITIDANAQGAGTGSDGHVILQPDANVGIGTTAPSQKLDIAGEIELANYLYFGNGSSNYLRWDATNFQISNTLLPITDATYSLGSDSNRWQDLYLSGSSLHMGTSGDEGILGYNTASDYFSFDPDADAVAEVVISDTGNLGIGSLTPAAALDVVGDAYISSGLSTFNSAVSDDTIEATTFCTGDGESNCVSDFSVLTNGSGIWATANGVIYPTNSTRDLLVGGTATTSAKFAFINVNSGTPTASISGNLAIAAPTGASPASTYSLFNGGSLNFLTSVGGDAGSTSRMFLSNAGNIGIGTTSPLAALHIGSGTTPNSIDGTGGDDVYIRDDLEVDGITTVGTLTSTGGTTTFGGGVVRWNSNGEYLYIQSQSDDGIHFALGTTGSGNNSMVITTQSNRSADHGHNTHATNPTVFVHSATAPGTNNTEWGSLSFEGTGSGGGYFNFATGVGHISLNPASGNVGIGDTSPTEMFTVGSGDLFQVNSSGEIVKIDGVAHTITDSTGDISINSNGGSLLLADTDTLVVGGLAGAAYNAFSDSGTTSHSLASDDDLYVEGDIEVDGTSYLDGAATVTGVLTANGTLDVNSDLTIADTNISLDGASTTFTQTTGAISFAPAAGTNLNVSLSTTGDFVVNTNDLYVDTSSGNVGIGSTTPGAALDVVGDITLSSGLTTFGTAVSDDTIEATTFCTGDGESNCVSDFSILSASSLWSSANGAIYPKNSTMDLLLGATATTSAKFGFLNVNSGTPTASVSAGVAGGTYLTSTGKLATTAMQNITLGDSTTTGDVIINPSRNVGIGTTAPGSKLHIYGGGTGAKTLQVRGNSSNDANIQEWQNGSGTALSVVDEAGWIGVGTTNPTAPLNVTTSAGDSSTGAASISYVSSYTGGSTQSALGVSVYGIDSGISGYNAISGSSTTPSGTSNTLAGLSGVQGSINYQGTAGTLTNGTAVTGAYTNSGAGTITYATAFNANMYLSGAGNVAVGHGFRLQTVNDSGAGSFQTLYGMYLTAITAASSNNYGIWGEAGDWILDEDGDGAAGGTTTGGGNIILGEGQDLELYHDGTNSYVTNNTGNLNLVTTGNLAIDAATSVSLDGDTSILLVDGGTTYGTITQSGTTDLQIDVVGGNLILASGDTLNIGGVGALGYNAISDSGVTSQTLNSDDDLYIEGDFEVDGSSYFDGAAQFNAALDSNGDITIADTSITLDGSSTNFVQSNGDITFTPAGDDVAVSSARLSQTNAYTTDAGSTTKEVSSTVTYGTTAQTGYTTNFGGAATINIGTNGHENFRAGQNTIGTSDTIGYLAAFRTGGGGLGNYWTTCQNTTCNLTNSYGLAISQLNGVATSNTFNITSSYGIYVNTENAFDYGGTMNITSRYAAYLGGVNTSGTSVGTNYGLYIADQALSSATNGYGIFGADGDWILDEDGDGAAGGTSGGGDIMLGAGRDLELYHDGTNSYIMNNTGDLYIGDAATDDVIMSNNGGNVGITTTAPTAKLHIVGGNGVTARVDTTAAGNVAKFELSEAGTSKWQLSNFGSSNDILVISGDGGLGVDDFLTINQSGNVGIGTTGPGAPLDVNGDIYTRSGITTFGTAVSDDTIEATQFCVGDGETNCVTDFSGITPSGWVDDGSTVRLSTAADFVSIGAATAHGKVGIDGARVGQALLVLDEEGDQNILTASASGTTVAHLARTGYLTAERFADISNSSYFVDPAATTSLLTAGNVGIGTTTAAQFLHVSSGTTDTVATFRSSDDTARIDIQDNDSTVYLGAKDAYGFLGGTNTLSTSNVNIDLSTGNIGLGTTAPLAKMHITGANAAAATGTSPNGSLMINNGDVYLTAGIEGNAPYAWMQVRNGIAATYYSLMLNPNGGNVGIGTTTASQLLHVNSGTTDTVATFRSSDDTGRIDIQDNDTTVYALAKDSYLSIGGTSTLATTNLNIHTTTGNTGIGDTSPDALLDFDFASTASSAGTEYGGFFTFSDTGNVSTGTDTGYGLNISYTRTGASGGTINSYGLNISATGDSGGTSTLTGLNVSVASADTNYAAAFSGGNVGVGTTTPGQSLDVAGQIELANYLYFGNASTEYLRWDGSTSFILSDDFIPSGSGYALGSLSAYWGTAYLSALDISDGGGNAGVIQPLATDMLSFGEFASYDFKDTGLTSFTTLSAPPAAAASGTVLNIKPVLTNMNGSDTVSLLGLNPTNGNHTTGSNFLYGINIASITGDAEATEVGLLINSGWDISAVFTGNVGIGDSTPDAQLELLATTEQLRLTHTDGVDETNFTVDTDGNLTINNSGTKTMFTDDVQVTGNDILDSGAATRISLGATTTLTNTATTLSGTATITASSLATLTTSSALSLGGATSFTFTADDATVYGSDSASGDLTLHGTSNATRTTSYVLIQPTAGNVGIGTTAPAATLDIQGPMVTDGSLSFQSILANDTTAYNSNPVAGQMFYNIYTSGGAFAGMGGITVGKENTTDGNYSSYLALHTRTNGSSVAERLRINSSGNVGIGSTSPAYKFDVATDIADYAAKIFNDGNSTSRTGLIIQVGADSGSGTNTAVRFNDGDGTQAGQITFTGTTMTYGSASDVRLKENITTSVRGLADLMQIQVADFNFKIDDSKRRWTGFLAQQLFEHFPDAVAVPNDPNDQWNVDYGKVTPLIVKSIQEQQYILEQQQVQLAAVTQQLGAVSLNSTGQIALSNQNGEYIATAVSSGSILTNISAFAQTVTANATAGLTTTRELIVQQSAQIANLSATNITVAGQSLRDFVANIVRDTVRQEELVSPVVQVALDPNEAFTVTTASGSAVASIDSTGKTKLADLIITGNASVSGTITSARLTALGELTAGSASISGELVAETVTAATISAESVRLATLEGRMAEFESIKAQTADLVNATVSGTLYANNIDGFESKVAAAFEEPSLLEILLQKTGQSPAATESAAPGNLADLHETISTVGIDASSSAELNLSLEDLELTTDDATLTASAAFINDYLKVNGSAYINNSLAVRQNLFVGEGMHIADGLIEYNAAPGQPQILAIQPSGKGTLSLLAGLMELNENGQVNITGNLAVAGDVRVEGSLLSNLLQPAEYGNPFQVQVAGIATESGQVKESRFEIVNELGAPVATISAQGRAAFAGGIGIGSESLSAPASESDTVTANKTSGKAAIAANVKEVIIKSEHLTGNSLIYVTPVGSTENKVLYVKSQTAENKETGEKEGQFVVGFDEAVGREVQFNWWVVN